MKLTRLMVNAGFTAPAFEADITDVVMDSRRVRKGSLFVAVKGARADGHDMALDACANGAAAVVAEHTTGLEKEIIVGDARKANALLASAFFENPGKKLKLIGVTGTNGKTTVSSVVKQALEALGHPSGLIGSAQCEIRDKVIPARFTTPEPRELNALLDMMVKSGCEYAVMETSSQALAQMRLFGQRFAVGVFTNLSRDHLDYHMTMEKYFKAKSELFSMTDVAVVNSDDEYGKRLIDNLDIPVVCFSDTSNYADITAKNVEFSTHGVRFAVNGDGFIGRVKFPFPGQYSVQNALAAISVLFALGVPGKDAADAVSLVKGVRGRSELVYRDDDITVLTDFAHTTEGLRMFISGIKPAVKGRLMVLFGCAGDRDAGKRGDMVRVVCELSDLAILTADNPRTEDPEGTIASLVPIFEEENTEYHTDPDRESAIRWALGQAREGDVLLLCGKGHEDYQVMDGYTVYLDERDIVEEFFAGERVSTPTTH